MIYNLILLFSLLVVTVVGRSVIGSWLAPGVFYAGYWIVFILVPFVTLGRKVVLNPIGFSWIVFTVILGIVCNLILQKKHNEIHDAGQCSTYIYVSGNKIYAHYVVIVITAIFGCVAPLLSVQEYGFRVSSLFDVAEIGDVGNTLSVARYSLSFYESSWTKVFKQFVYISPGIAAILVAIYPSGKAKILSLLSLMPALLMAIVHTTKASIVFSIIIYLSWYLSVSIYIKRKKDLRSYFSPLKVFLSISFLAVIFVVTSAIRYKKFDIILITGRLTNAFTAQLFLFSEWFGQNWNQLQEPLFGMYTFSGLYAIFKHSARQIGLGYVTLSSMDLGSNIYTVHRGLIEDYHLIGAMLFFLILFSISSYSYNKVLSSKKAPHFHIGVLACSYSIMMWSSVANIFTYNSIIAAYVFIYLFFAILYRNELYEKNSEGR